ncbi:hypothetical protein DFP72DRAFT_899560 [Ephemerocybe angulata]|uniref:O-fucosyltransferase family protein n=1 Tax=Ephemerocybe angulata TaxID=980116 RepID=A0A8H6HYL2_9AGAR|nr:hypothetical protein DFP72DRAFT_899560 [Tulosesus angulatus]
MPKRLSESEPRTDMPLLSSHIWRISRRERRVIGLLVIIAVLYAVQSIGFLQKAQPTIVQVSLVSKEGIKPEGEAERPVAEVDRQVEADHWTLPRNSLNYPYPTTTARENLKNGTYYVTGFALAGFTNQFIAYMHLIYLGIQSERIPVIPPVTPSSHVSNKAGALRFSRVFNISATSKILRRPVLEWAHVKEYQENASVSIIPQGTDPSVEQFGCWSVRQRNFPTPIWVPIAENVLKVDLSFTRVPPIAFFDETNQGDVHTKFSALASLIMPKYPHPASKGLPLMAKSRLGSSLPPGEHMACFDFLYYVSSGLRRHEFENRWSPAWNSVGTHIRFTDELVMLARGYILRAMGLEGEIIPPIISLHIRRGDFRNHCKKGMTPPCYIPLQRYHDSIENVRTELLATQNINATRVLVASDERDPEFWKEVSGYGWHYINHTVERTLERYGEWYPVLIDTTALSIGSGFVGTKSSTFSVLTARRVEDWNGGLTDMVDYFAKD